jgi:hypothetical protein
MKRLEQEMKIDGKSSEQLLNQAIESARRDRPPAESLNRSIDRVRQSLEGGDGALLGCSDFQGLMPDFLEGAMKPARRLLMEDHIGRCARCRRRMQAIAAGESKPFERPSPKIERPRRRRWAVIAAAALLGAVLIPVALQDGAIPFTSEAWTVVEAAEGPLFRLEGRDLRPIFTGDRLEASTRLRTGSGSSALLKMADGSSIEVSERAQLMVRAGWRGNRIELERGGIIVEAAEQGRDRLSVSTADLRVEVRGTTFSVSQGLKGSRISVLEGEVRVKERGQEFALKAGEQFSSGRKLAAAPIANEIAWSRNVDSHLAALKGIQDLGQRLQSATVSDSLRYSSELVDLIPASPVFVAAFPNLTSQLYEALAELSQRISQDPLLAGLMGPDSEAGSGLLGGLVDRFKPAGEKLGPELVLAGVNDVSGQLRPLLLSTTEDGPGLEQALRNEMLRLEAETGAKLPVVIAVDMDGHHESAELWVLIRGRWVAASTSREILQQVVAILEGRAGAAFAGSRFSETIREEYAQGVDWLASVDLEQLTDDLGSPLPEPAIAWLGVEQIDSLVLQRKRVGQEIESRAVLRYQGEGDGLAALLGRPASMGGLEFVTPEAQFVSAFVVQRPADVVDRLFSTLERFDPDAWKELVEFQIEKGVNFRDDLAAPLGGEFVFALDGSLLPTPSWKLIVEVYDVQRFQQSMLRMVDELNRNLEGRGGGFTLLASPGNPSEFVFSSGNGNGLEMHYRFDSGYLIAAPSSALISRAVQSQRAGYSLAASAEFQRLLPRDARANLSALYYHRMASLLEPFLKGGHGWDKESPPAVEAILAASQPSLFALYSEPNRLSLAGSGGQEALWLNLAAVAAIGQGDLPGMTGRRR